MTVEEAIVTALAQEHRVRDHFRKAAEEAPKGEVQAFFALMTREEQGHVDYLEAKLTQWRETGTVGETKLTTAVPRRDWLVAGEGSLRGSRPAAARAAPRDHLFVALELEHQVTEFYRRLVESVDDPRASELFRRFLEIEDGHTALVQAEIDHETHTGVFFDVREFTLDG
ncbi:MAG: hypothetical protein IH608_08260 [Proteobacteria bacterium]|nr:hypothetical protein [Pseudomonadota bacterium]